MRPLIGADPELFVWENMTNRYISGHFFQFGSKTEPKKLETCYAQNDGMALEFNIEPAESVGKFFVRIKSAMKELSAHLPPGYTLVPVSTAQFPESYIQGVPKQYAELGCNPDMNAWTLQVNPSPNARLPFRTGSGHIHIGWTKDVNPEDFDHILKCAGIVRELDYRIGLPSLLWDKDTQRRKLYGRAGAFRPKPYGLEYRTPSNAWLRDDQTIKFVYKQAVRAFQEVVQMKNLADTFGASARDFINNDILDWPKQDPRLRNALELPNAQ